MRIRFVPLSALLLVAGIATPTHSLQAKDVTEAKLPQDRIEVKGHFPLANDRVERLLPTQHYSRYYLYAEYAGGKGATVIDITDAATPTLVANVRYAAKGQPGDLLTLAGTAALVAGRAPERSIEFPQSIRIMNFADPAHPKVAHEFTGVTATGRDAQRGLVFLANGDGIWILHERLAEDPALLSAYAHHVLYDH